jgi:DNA-binding response OmpR family regulator
VQDARQAQHYGADSHPAASPARGANTLCVFPQRYYFSPGLAQTDGPEQKTKKRILIAEDDDSIAVMLTKILEQKYEVQRVRTGLEALENALKFKPNLFILDVMMPALDGYTTAQKLRKLPELKQASIIFLTAKGGALDIVKGIQSGARFYVTKPFKMDDLLAKVRKALGE